MKQTTMLKYVLKYPIGKNGFKFHPNDDRNVKFWLKEGVELIATMHERAMPVIENSLTASDDGKYRITDPDAVRNYYQTIKYDALDGYFYADFELWNGEAEKVLDVSAPVMLVPELSIDMNSPELFYLDFYTAVGQVESASAGALIFDAIMQRLKKYERDEEYDSTLKLDFIADSMDYRKRTLPVNPSLAKLMQCPLLMVQFAPFKREAANLVALRRLSAAQE